MFLWGSHKPASGYLIIFANHLEKKRRYREREGEDNYKISLKNYLRAPSQERFPIGKEKTRETSIQTSFRPNLISLGNPSKIVLTQVPLGGGGSRLRAPATLDVTFAN